MADTARGQVSMTPIVTNAGVGDSDDVDVMHNEVGGSVGGKLEHIAVSNDKWWYDADKDVTTNADLISGAYTSSGTAATGDVVKYLSITHTGKNASGDATSIEVHISLDGGTPQGQTDALAIGKSESMILKPAGALTVGNLHVASADDTSVVCKVVAMVNDPS